jgi:hypothetical protein
MASNTNSGVGVVPDKINKENVSVYLDQSAVEI